MAGWLSLGNPHLSCKLAEIDLELPSAYEFNLGFSLRSECKWWVYFEDKMAYKLKSDWVKGSRQCWGQNPTVFKARSGSV